MKRSFLIAAIVMSVLILGGGSVALYYRTYWGEFYDVRQQLQEIPSVQVLDMGALEDVTVEAIWAVVLVEGKGVIKFHNLTDSSFLNNGHIQIR